MSSGFLWSVLCTRVSVWGPLSMWPPDRKLQQHTARRHQQHLTQSWTLSGQKDVYILETRQRQTAALFDRANMADHHLHTGHSPLGQPAGPPRTGVSCRLSGISLSWALVLLLRPTDQYQRSQFTSHRGHWWIWGKGFSIGGLRLSGWSLIFFILRLVVAVRRTKGSEWGQFYCTKRQNWTQWSSEYLLFLSMTGFYQEFS